MNNQIKNIILVLSISLLLGLFFANQAQANGLSLDVIKECNFRYGGETCIAEFDITNSTEEVLDGTAFFDVGYNGVCGNYFKEGGIDAWYDNQVSKMEWNDRSKRFISADFEIPNGLSKANLEIHTSLALCPGEYTFNLELKGTFEEEEYTTPPVVIGVVIGGGGGGGHLVVCGDGIREWEEQCDDGNTISGDGCSSVCKTEVGQVAGASIEQQGGGEEQGGGGEQQGGGGTGQIAGATTGESKEQGTEGQGPEEEQGAGNEEVPGQEANAGAESKQGLPLLAAIGNILSFGTGNAWLAIIIGIIILALLILIVFKITRRAKRRNFEKNLKK